MNVKLDRQTEKYIYEMTRRNPLYVLLSEFPNNAAGRFCQQENTRRFKWLSIVYCLSYSLPTFRFLARVLASPFFWLHIKKSAGSSLRRLLQPYYRCIDRSINPCCFVGVSKEYWNDTVNNYRIHLGEFQFRRASFARKYLYGKDWERMNSFAFVREPVSRALSMFRFLQPEIRSYAISLRISKCSPSDLFDLFLKMLLLQRESSISSKPFGLRFSTHVNPAWNDVVDVDGNVLIAIYFVLRILNEGLARFMPNAVLSCQKLLQVFITKLLARTDRYFSANWVTKSKGIGVLSKRLISLSGTVLLLP